MQYLRAPGRVRSGAYTSPMTHHAPNTCTFSFATAVEVAR
ncbi:hypothetical protein BX261_7277 [Streptomyces sp. 2321.6]|nr:hypothetical protein BX261_7277 [Streptomyces sp. 2321.6]